jgi:hypothetical protein
MSKNWNRHINNKKLYCYTIEKGKYTSKRTDQTKINNVLKIVKMYPYIPEYCQTCKYQNLKKLMHWDSLKYFMYLIPAPNFINFWVGPDILLI